MAKKNANTRTSLENVNDSITTFEQRLEKNKKLITYFAIGVVAIIVVAAVYIYGIRQPGIEEAQAMVNKADVQMIQGQTDKALELYKKAFNASSYKPANRAGLMAAQILYQKGKTDEALKMLEQCNYYGKIAGPANKSLEGDCYVNKSKFAEALAAYDEAINMAGDNDAYTPFFMMKKAAVLEKTQKYADAQGVYESIQTNYPYYGEQIGIARYVERAKAEAGK